MLTLLFIFTALSRAVSQYILYTENKTWFEAQIFCRANHSDLATIVNLDENYLISTFGNVEYAWIGLYDDATKWMWTNGNTDLNSTGFTNWDTSNPDYNFPDASETTICVVMDSKGFWDDTDCRNGYPRVCYEDPNVYSLVNSPLSWTGSRSDCASSNKHLTSVRDENENAAVEHKIIKSAWIGLYRHTWVNWSDSTYSTFSNWDDSMNSYLNTSADFHCAMVHILTGTWFRASCYARHPFICNTVLSGSGTSGSGSGSGGHNSGGGGSDSGDGEGSGSGGVVSIGEGGGTFNAAYMKRVKLILKTDANLNSPDIQLQILQQIHSKLEEQAKSDFKLGWILNGRLSWDEEKEHQKCIYHL